MIQTYQPDHYSIRTAATQDYESFYSQEMAYRRLLGYPPAVALLTVQMACPAEGTLAQTADLAAGGCSSGRTAWSGKKYRDTSLSGS